MGGYKGGCGGVVDTGEVLGFERGKKEGKGL